MNIYIELKLVVLKIRILKNVFFTKDTTVLINNVNGIYIL